MRAALAALSLVLATCPTIAADRYSGRYSAECGTLVCELDIAPAGRDRWRIRWTATDPTILDARPKCAFSTTARIGAAQLGPAGIIDGIAVGEWRGRPFGLFDIPEGRVSWSSSWQACPGIAPKGIYSEFGDE
ncbi:hypothetical protein GCM10011390_03400 [Aureimonas endophytica]|uniref:Uncharacterized protein n=1 Tax=Aureimonas endophytica TaxID=2027858 RepID=A0A916ZCE6_9HYPH|nr:hypothetical protein [Aureimonas endophytica]GGD87956.1 hypothetical protein GCM10011390_03400 [Aureimonas endophytica]